MIQLLTATGARPEAWSLCKRWMRNQDYRGKVRWIIVDDGPIPSQEPRIKGWQTVILRPEPFWSPGQNTQARNLRAGLELVDDDKPLLIAEDDDHYKPGWISRAVSELENHDLVGQKLCRKYSLRNRRAREIQSPRLSSLCSTAMIGDGIRAFRSVVQSAPRLMDCALWAAYRGHLFDGDYVTSIKCLPGRAGIDSGHKPNFGEIADPDGKLLRQWIGPDAKYYERFIHAESG